MNSENNEADSTQDSAALTLAAAQLTRLHRDGAGRAVAHFRAYSRPGVYVLSGNASPGARVFNLEDLKTGKTLTFASPGPLRECDLRPQLKTLVRECVAADFGAQLSAHFDRLDGLALMDPDDAASFACSVVSAARSVAPRAIAIGVALAAIGVDEAEAVAYAVEVFSNAKEEGNGAGSEWLDNFERYDIIRALDEYNQRFESGDFDGPDDYIEGC